MPIPRLFFRILPAAQGEWLCPDNIVQRGPLPELANQSGNARLILVAPSETVTLHQIPLPARNRALWARAVPYALEDQLIDDIETLHFAMAHTPDGNRLPVATLDHVVLRDWLETCAQAGLAPTAVIPDALLLPWQEGDWSVLVENGRAVVRTGCWAGFALERESLNLFLEQALAEAGDAQPQRLRIWGSPPPERIASSITWQVEEGLGEPLQLFMAGYQPATILNLLQGPYSRQTQWKRRLRPWRAAAILAGVWLLLQGTALVYEHQQLRREQVALGVQMEEVYKIAVPGATRIVNPKVQLETRLDELTPTDQRSGAFLELLYQGGQPLADFPDIALRSLSYREGQLDLALEGGNPATLDQLRQRLEQQPGIQAEMRTTQREGRLESRVTLKKAAS
ncbi:MAG: type II secretion system protein GspL [Candidatus Competibacteraceae bacterium]|nr:type II secretion system protein GspL [Candidatus Competibacteraceae bacterium]MCB1820030.1 type II secretion system protein GspL [Candidatus Competibacteraceae bacterium]HRY15245.1 type II secretion system protein GspL [Candidatus Competibacteraceae bacterium]